MKSAKGCKDRFEDIVAFVMGELDPPAARRLQEHLATCGRCREACNALAEEEKEVRSGFGALAAALRTSMGCPRRFNLLCPRQLPLH